MFLWELITNIGIKIVSTKMFRAHCTSEWIVRNEIVSFLYLNEKASFGGSERSRKIHIDASATARHHFTIAVLNGCLKAVL